MTIPPELKRSTPRAVSLTRAGWRAILWPSLVAVCIVIGMQAPHPKHATGVLFILWWWYRNPLFDLGMILLGPGIGWMRYRRQKNLLMYGRAAVASVTGYDRPSFCVGSANLPGEEIPDLPCAIPPGC